MKSMQGKRRISTQTFSNVKVERFMDKKSRLSGDGTVVIYERQIAVKEPRIKKVKAQKYKIGAPVKRMAWSEVPKELQRLIRTSYYERKELIEYMPTFEHWLIHQYDIDPNS